MTFPDDLFYPVGVHSAGIFVKKGVPHPEDQNVLWIRALNDGFVKSKGKRLPNEKAKDDFATVRSTVKAFLADPSLEVPNIEQFQKAAPIDLSDTLLELVPENYLDQALPSEEDIREGIEQVIRDSVAYLIRAGKEDK
jgi:type I restriction-modification system DNA methylase subunit